MELILKKATAYTVHSSDSDRTSSNKGAYKDFNIATVRAKGSGWYGADGEVKMIEVWEDKDGNLFTVKPIGKYTDEDEKYREETLKSIKSKLTKEELKLLGIK
jgi:hypothetical protein